MSDQLQPDASSDAAPSDLPGEAEEVDAVVVVSAAETAITPARTIVPAVQAAAVAATGFVAGAAAVGLMHRRRHRRDLTRRGSSRRIGRRSQRSGGGAVGELVQIVGSRSLLVDVHLLGGSGRNR